MPANNSITPKHNGFAIRNNALGERYFTIATSHRLQIMRTRLLRATGCRQTPSRALRVPAQERPFRKAAACFEKQGGSMDAHEGAKRKDTCLNAVSPITCSQPSQIPRTTGAAVTVICLRGLYRLSVAEHNLWAGKSQQTQLKRNAWGRGRGCVSRHGHSRGYPVHPSSCRVFSKGARRHPQGKDASDWGDDRLGNDFRTTKLRSPGPAR
jgi:hypothetical protein